MASPKAPEVKVVVVATDPTGHEVAFETSGWSAAHRLRREIDSYPNRTYGWQFLTMMRLVGQREVRT